MSASLLSSIFGALLDDEGALSLRAEIDECAATIFVTRALRRDRLETDLTREEQDALHAYALEHGTTPINTPSHKGTLCKDDASGLLFARAERVLLDTKIDMNALVLEGTLSEHIADDLVKVCQMGHGLCVLGPSSAHNERVLAACANAMREHFCVRQFDSSALAEANDALASGAQVLVQKGAHPNQFVRLVQGAPEAIWLSALACANVASAKLSENFLQAAPHLLVLGLLPDGRVRVLERHVPEGASMMASAQPSRRTNAPTNAATEFSFHQDARAQAPIQALDELPPVPEIGEAPPASWGADDAEHDVHLPLHLSSEPLHSDDDGQEKLAGHEGFEAALLDVQSRPTFTPQKPSLTPQAKALKEMNEEGEDPFGGLTFEPPRTVDEKS